MSERSRSALGVAAVVLLVGVLLVAQAGVDRLTPEGTSSAGRAVGRAGFAYLTGIRTFAAAVLYDRIEPLFHSYYQDRSLAEQDWVLPTVRFVVELDPQFVDAYYGAAYQLCARGDVDTGLELARLGVNNNPRSGILRASLAEILLLYAEEPGAAATQADAGLTADWSDPIEKYRGYAIFYQVFRAAGMADKAESVKAELDALGAEIGDGLPPAAGSGHGTAGR